MAEKKNSFMKQLVSENESPRTAFSSETTIPECLAALAAFLVDVGREGFGHKQTSTGLMSNYVTDNRDMSGGFDR